MSCRSRETLFLAAVTFLRPLVVNWERERERVATKRMLLVKLFRKIWSLDNSRSKTGWKSIASESWGKLWDLIWPGIWAIWAITYKYKSQFLTTNCLPGCVCPCVKVYHPKLAGSITVFQYYSLNDLSVIDSKSGEMYVADEPTRLWSRI